MSLTQEQEAVIKANAKTIKFLFCDCIKYTVGCFYKKVDGVVIFSCKDCEQVFYKAIQDVE